MFITSNTTTIPRSTRVPNTTKQSQPRSATTNHNHSQPIMSSFSKQLPIKLKRERKRKHGKRRPYRRYNQATWDWEIVLEEAKHNNVRQTANKYNIEYSTLVKRLQRVRKLGVQEASIDHRETSRNLH